MRFLKMLCLILMSFLLLGLVACNKTPSDDQPKKDTEEPVDNPTVDPDPDPDPNSDPNTNPDPNTDPNPEVPFVRFTQEEFTITIDINYELTYETNYDGELQWECSDDDLIWLDEPYAMGLDLGQATVTISFEIDGVKYSDTAVIKIIDTVYTITIEDKKYDVLMNTTYEEFLTEIFGENGYPEKEGFEFVDWYLDSDYLRVCRPYNKVTGNATLYPKYKKFIYGVNIDKVYGYRASDAVNGQVVAISPAYSGDFNALVLDNYELIAIRYNPSEADYFVVETGKKVLYYDGFLLCIKKDSAESEEFLPKLSVGTKVWLDSYTINNATKVQLERTLDKTVETFDLSGIDARFVSAYDATNKVVIGTKSGDSRAYPASTTKIITAMAALKYCPVNTTYTIGAEQDVMWQGSSPSTAGVKKGEVWTLHQLLYATLLPSGNDAAYAVAALTINYLYPNNTWTAREQIDKFAELMNEVAREAGATNSHFMVPDGNSYYTSSGNWDDRLTYHYVTANDMVKIATYAFNFGEIAEVVSTTSVSVKIEGTASPYTWSNTNHLLNPSHSAHYPGTVGMKTGTTTPAGQCLITGVYKEDRLIVLAIMYAGNGGRDSASLAVYNKIFK